MTLTLQDLAALVGIVATATSVLFFVLRQSITVALTDFAAELTGMYVSRSEVEIMRDDALLDHAEFRRRIEALEVARSGSPADTCG
jgi:hypothetical protein